MTNGRQECYGPAARGMVADEWAKSVTALERAVSALKGVRLADPAPAVRARLQAAADAAECASAELRSLLHRLDEHHSTTRVQEGA